MRVAALVLLFVCFVECRKIVPPINKHANIDFINMESGGVRQPVPKAAPAPAPAPKPVPAPAPAAPVPTTKAPVQAPAPKPAVAPQPMKPVQPAQPSPAAIKPVPVNPAPVANPITTPGPGSVKSLVNFYNAQGKGSPIRPYTYSQAVKQG